MGSLHVHSDYSIEKVTNQGATYGQLPPVATATPSSGQVSSSSKFQHGADLFPQHAKMLADSAIRPDVLEARGYRSIGIKAELQRLGFTNSQIQVPTLLIPIWSVQGEIGLYHHRPDVPRMRSGRIAKYEFPAGERMIVDVHPFIKDKVRDAATPLFMTEGIKKADSAISLGLCCIALIGTWNWRGTNELGSKTALPDWDFIALKDRNNQPRQIYICYDSDVMLKPQVHQALARLSEFLKKRGAQVAYIYLPSADDASKVGLDDFLASGHSKEDLLALASPELREIESSTEKSPSQATKLVRLADSDVEFWHTPEGEAYASIRVKGHVETSPLRTKAFKTWLSGRFYSELGTPPGAQAMQDAIGALEAKALYDGEQHREFIRLGRHDDAIYVDLANEQWQAIRITAEGWELEDNPPVHFRRPKSMLPLPTPQRGGSISDLRRFVNVASDEDWVLLLAFLVAALKPEGPYSILAIAGEQGSAKSTLARLIRLLVDPSKAPLRSEPRNRQDLMIAAHNSWLPTFDNLSNIRDWLSDDLCRLTSGGGFATRELYSDSDEVIFDVQRPAMLTSIEDIATRGDLLDRAIILTLAPIPAARRRPESELWHDFEDVQPLILGALCEAVSTALRNLPHTKVQGLPRMADFSLWATAAEPALGLEQGAFLKAYMGNKADANSLALEAEPVAARVTQFVGSLSETEWHGTATELLGSLDQLLTETERKADDWPKRADKLSGKLRRIAPNLRQQGIDITFDDRDSSRKRSRQITIRKLPMNSVRSVQSAQIASETEPGVASANYTYGNATDATDATDATIPLESNLAANQNGNADLNNTELVELSPSQVTPAG
jgi:hypothetical protein